MRSAQETLEQVSKFLDDDGIAYDPRADALVIDLLFRLPNGNFLAAIFVREPPPMLGIGVCLPIVVPQERRVEVAEAIVRANFGLSFGRFELNMSDGELSFYNSLPLADAPLTPGQFRALLAAAVGTAGRYLRAFNRLLYGDDLSPAEVIAEVEMAN